MNILLITTILQVLVSVSMFILAVTIVKKYNELADEVNDHTEWFKTFDRDLNQMFAEIETHKITFDEIIEKHEKTREDLKNTDKICDKLLKTSSDATDTIKLIVDSLDGDIGKRYRTKVKIQELRFKNKQKLERLMNGGLTDSDVQELIESKSKNENRIMVLLKELPVRRD